MPGRIVKKILLQKRPDFIRLSLTLIILITLVSLAIILITARIVKEKAVHDLAKYDAKQITSFVYQALYSGMVKGWTKEEIVSTVERLNKVEPEMRINVYRGRPIIEQYGEIPGEKELRDSDLLIQKALRGEEILLKQDGYLRYIYPIKAEDSCVRCHTNFTKKMTVGVIDVTYPIQNLKISLDFLINIGLIFFTLFIIAIFLIFYFSLRYFIIKPIHSFMDVIAEIIALSDLNKRIPRTSYIKEILDLTDHFNKLLQTIQDYYKRLEELSYKDPLTGLYNRRKFEELLEYEIYRAKRYNHEFSILMIDIDNFKYINDTFGHPTGDLVLKEIASFILTNVRQSDIPARIGGDEFALILPETSPDNGLTVAEKLRRLLCETPVSILSGDIKVQASFGLASFPVNGEKAQELLTASDVALYRAKHMGKNKVIMLETEDKEVMMEMAVRGDFIKKAIQQERVQPFFQPIVEISSGKIYGYDIHARIKDEDGYILAGQFIRPATELGYIEEIDRIIFERSISLYHTIQQKSAITAPKLFFNASVERFFNKDFVNDVIKTLNKYNVLPENIIFQITESEALPTINRFIELINSLKAHGVGFLLKDFGSGFSSFMYLKYLDVSYVKIEGSLIKNINIDRRDLVLVRHMVEMLQRFNIKSVASHVENIEVHKILRDMGLDFAQGFYYGYPDSFEKIFKIGS